MGLRAWIDGECCDTHLPGAQLSASKTQGREGEELAEFEAWRTGSVAVHRGQAMTTACTEGSAVRWQTGEALWSWNQQDLGVKDASVSLSD